MIVVDTNVLVYAVFRDSHGELARRVAARDPAWVAPRLWRLELRNVLVTAMRARGLALQRALAAFAGAEELVVDAGVEPTTEESLEIAHRGRVSAYDAELVFVAERLDLVLVTGDTRLAKAFPERVQTMAEYAG